MMDQTVADAAMHEARLFRMYIQEALIEAARRIAPLVRTCRDEGERERRLPPQVLAASKSTRSPR